MHDALALRTNRWWRRLPRLAAAVDAFLLHRLLRTQGVQEYVFWLSVPAPEWMAGMRRDRMVYDCIDPLFETEGRETFDERERSVADEARVVFCTAQTLLEHMRTMHQDVHLLNNAASPELFEVEQAGATGTPPALAGRPQPVVGYLGTIDRRIDAETLTAVARAMPDHTFCLAGRVNSDQEARVAELRALPNVVMPGAVPIDEGAAYNEAFDVALIPFEPGYVGDAINPVKMYMYLLAGKPVVSTWINECRLVSPLVHATHGADEFIRAVRAAGEESDPGLAEARIAFARRNTWDDRARSAVDVLRERGLLDPLA